MEKDNFAGKTVKFMSEIGKMDISMEQGHGEIYQEIIILVLGMKISNKVTEFIYIKVFL